jgi:hypothetical protein
MSSNRAIHLSLGAATLGELIGRCAAVESVSDEGAADRASYAEVEIPYERNPSPV